MGCGVGGRFTRSGAAEAYVDDVGLFAGKPAPAHASVIGRRLVVGAGSPANGPGLPANFHPPFTVAAATVFAGKPAPTHASRAAQADVGAGLPANGPGLPANIHPPFTVAAATVFAGKPAPTHASRAAQAVVGAGLPAKGPVQAKIGPLLFPRIGHLSSASQGLTCRHLSSRKAHESISHHPLRTARRPNTRLGPR
ncbi:hypothetical protein CW309_27890 [Pseudomonas hunanensis]|uniref:Uncharacterized protein n=1 Tax=Pseudomonas hunanensis TaxID=1247546 RepID=A0ACC9MWG4_9PSED|nr:hypothetical protein CW309_27890 [Pseudomonas hunanensis]